MRTVRGSINRRKGLCCRSYRILELQSRHGQKSVDFDSCFLALTAGFASAQEVGKPDIPAGWTAASNSKQNPELWHCASYGGSWIVGNDKERLVIHDLAHGTRKEQTIPPQLKLSKEMIGSRSLLKTSDGWLIGFDAGEFGGGLWWFSQDGSNVKKLMGENVHAIYKTPSGVFVLAGLAHLGLDRGGLYQFVDTPEKISLKYVTTLGASPEASMLDHDGNILIATMHGVLRVDKDARVRTIYKSDEWLIYPTSITEDSTGGIFVGMRFFILQVTPQEDGASKGEFLVREQCKTFKIEKYICKCTGKL